MNKKKDSTFYTFSITLSILFFLISCEGGIGKFNENMGKISETVRKIDTAAANVSKGLSKVSKVTERYVDTTIYKKDSTGMWKRKQ